MQVRELELSGFKSFVDRVKLQFKPGITALVGPNGCGKSNIMDAMRWIMGEHNARNLRGTRMEDLIFSGSETRKPHGMAEVSMVLTRPDGNGNGNGNGHSVMRTACELMVTRRLYRTGDSEYFINKVPCRQKDIVELFLDSGVGSKSYSIMEQGKVDFILSLKPEERRTLIEEAAGIAKYRSRKKEALSKMQSTRNNLARLTDVLGEIQSQMRFLDLQVKRLKRYRRLKEDAREIELLLIAHRLATHATDRDGLDAELRRLQDQELHLCAESSRIEADLQQQRLTVTEHRTRIGSLQQEVYGARSDIQQQENTIRLHESERHTARQLVLKAEQDIAECDRLRQESIAEIDRCTTECESLATQAAVMEDKVSGARDHVAEAKSRARELQQTTEAANQQLMETVFSETEARNALQMNQRIATELSTRTDKLQTEITASTRQVADLDTQHEQGCAALDRLRQHSTELEQHAEHLAVEFSRCEQELTELHSRESGLRESCETVRARLSTLEEMQQRREGYNRGVRTLLGTEDTPDKFPGVVAVLADKIETDPEYELPVEAVLDRRLQTIIVESDTDASAAITHLQHHAGGRATILPRAVPPRGTRIDPPAGCQRLLDLVRSREGYADCVAALLHDVILVPSLADAVAVSRGSATPVTCVTPAGDVIDSCGTMTGGSADASETGILKRNRQVREYRRQLDESQRQLRDLQEVIASQRQRRTELSEERSAVAERLKACQIDCVQQQHTVERIAAERYRLQDRLQVLGAELEQARAELATARQQIETHEQALTQASTQVREQREAIIVMQREETLLREQLEQTEKNHTDLQIRLASARQRHEHLQTSIQQYTTQRDHALRRHGELEQERVRLASRITDLGQTIEDTRTALQKKTAACRELEQQVAAAQEESTATEQSVSDLENSLKQTKRAAEEIAPRINQLKIDRSSIDVHIEHLHKELTDKYAIPVAQLPEAPDAATFDPAEHTEQLEKTKKRIDNIGEVNLGAARQYEELEQRYTFLTAQQDDLLQSIDALQKVIAKINRVTRHKFQETFESINNHFKQLFPLLFNGGKAYMELSDAQDLLETGIEIFAQPPGKKLQNLDLLSGGERALTVIALMFAIFLTKPSPFCLMDEIDAPLDDSNIGRFIDHLHQMAQRSQFIIITHNKLSMQAANSLYGVTMEERGVSKIVSVSLN